MKIIALDLSTKSSGYAVFDNKELIDYGMVKSFNPNWRERIYEIGKQLNKLFRQYKPDKIFVEDVPLSTKGGIKVAIMLGAVQGLVYGLSAFKNIDIEFVLPSKWRSPLGLFDGSRQGTKRDELKRKSVEMANKEFNLSLVYKSPSSKFNEDDISDAILLGKSQIDKKIFGKVLDK